MKKIFWILLIISVLGNIYSLTLSDEENLGSSSVSSQFMERVQKREVNQPKKENVNSFEFSRTFVEMASHLSGSGSIAKKFELTDVGKQYISDVRSQHKPPTLIPKEKFSEGLCAGYLYELTATMWGVDVPIYIGMQHPETRTPADARELPYTYRYRGGTIAHEITPEIGVQIKRSPTLFPELVSPQWIEEFFIAAFSPDSWFGDVGFLYAQTAYTHMLGAYDNFNSHIGKNFGISRFDRVIESENDDLLPLLQETLGCENSLWSHHVPVLLHYQWYINDEPVRLIQDGRFISEETKKDINLQQLDVLSYDDITIAHFFEGAHADSLLQMSCQGEFYPINVLQINPSFLQTN